MFQFAELAAVNDSRSVNVSTQATCGTSAVCDVALRRLLRHPLGAFWHSRQCSEFCPPFGVPTLQTVLPFGAPPFVNAGTLGIACATIATLGQHFRTLLKATVSLQFGQSCLLACATTTPEFLLTSETTVKHCIPLDCKLLSAKIISLFHVITKRVPPREGNTGVSPGSSENEPTPKR